jgi:hypothetical protein
MFYDFDFIIRKVFDSKAVRMVLEYLGVFANLIRLIVSSRVTGRKQVSFGSFPSLIFSIRSNEHGGSLAGMTGQEHQGKIIDTDAH